MSSISSSIPLCFFILVLERHSRFHFSFLNPNIYFLLPNLFLYYFILLRILDFKFRILSLLHFPLSSVSSPSVTVFHLLYPHEILLFRCYWNGDSGQLLCCSSSYWCEHYCVLDGRYRIIFLYLLQIISFTIAVSFLAVIFSLSH